MKRALVFAVALGFVVFVWAEGKDQTATLQRPVEVQSGESVTDFDGNKYRIVTIGSQTWMAENLRSTHYPDGSPIACFDYANDPGKVKTYGRLYSSGAVMHGAASSNSNPGGVQGVAPKGWHVPSVAEWQQLADYLGGLEVAGGKLKEAGTGHWVPPNVGATDEVRFTALPAGEHDFTGIYQWIGDHGCFATSTVNPAPSYSVKAVLLASAGAGMGFVNVHPDDACSVRCVKDSSK